LQDTIVGLPAANFIIDYRHIPIIAPIYVSAAALQKPSIKIKRNSLMKISLSARKMFLLLKNGWGAKLAMHISVKIHKDREDFL
jgi:hypothetical protein